MSQPSPDAHEQGRGMDAHNEVMREVRARNDRSYDPREPTRVWLDEDNTPDGVYRSLTIILNTGGCRWARAGGCTMCGYVAESVDGGSVAHGDLMTQVERCLEHEAENVGERSASGGRTQSDDAGGEAGLVKIYTSGSFLDEREIPAETREAIAETFADRDRIVVESLPDFVDREKLRDLTDRGLEADVAIGLETATDRVRHDAVNKYFDFSAFEAACEEARAAGAKRAPPDGLAETDGSRETADAGVKAYLLMKPPFLAEPDAVADMKRSVRRCAAVEGCHTVSMNPCNVQRHTMVEELYHEGGYRPPWLWSVCEVLASTAGVPGSDATGGSSDERSESDGVDAIVVSDPVGHGSDRGPHNCGECDDLVQRAIKDFDLRQDPSVFEEVSCECEATWEYVMDNETAYNQPLVR